MAEEEKVEATEEAKPKSKKMLIILAAGLIAFLGIGGGAAFFILGKPKPAPPPEVAEGAEPEAEEGKPPAAEHGESEKKEPEKKEAAAEHGAAKPAEAKGGHDGAAKPAGAAAPASPKAPSIDFGATLALQPFDINLGNPLENRFMRLTISLEYKSGEEQKKEIEARMPQLRDAVISVASRKTREFLLGPDGKDQLRLEILNRINQYMDRKIENIYVTDILIE